MKKTFEEVIAEYQNKFGEAFPVLHFQAVPEIVIIEQVEQCIQDNEPYNPPDDGNIY